MSYRVIYAPSFRNDIGEQIDFLRERQVPEATIESWFNRLFDHVEALAEMPSRYPVDDRMTEIPGFEVRKLVHARFVITYQVDETQQAVHLLAMVHGARRT